jgi:hypothetical protein
MVPVGYLLMALNNLNGDSGSYSMFFWFYRMPVQPIGWMIFGGVLGALWHAISQLNSN